MNRNKRKPKSCITTLNKISELLDYDLQSTRLAIQAKCAGFYRELNRGEPQLWTEEANLIDVSNANKTVLKRAICFQEQDNQKPLQNLVYRHDEVNTNVRKQK